MSNPVEEVIKIYRVLCKTGSMIFIVIALLIQSVYAAPSATFRIEHKISGQGLTPAYSGHDERNRSIGAWSDIGTGSDKSFRWYFDQVDDEFTGDPTEFFYIHNLETGLVLTRNPEDNEITNWGRVEGDQSQHWRLDSSTNDGSVMIINRAYDQFLTQGFYGTDPNEHIVATFPFDTNVTGGFSWFLNKAGDVELSKIHIGEVKCEIPSKGTDGATTVLLLGTDLLLCAKFKLCDGIVSGSFSQIQGETWSKNFMMTYADLQGSLDAEAAAEFQKALDGSYTTTDDVFIDINGQQIWPAGGEVNMGQNDIENANTVFIYEDKLGATIRFEEYDYASDNDHLGQQYIKPRTTISPTSKLYKGIFFDLDHERSFYSADINISEYRTFDPTKPVNVELVIEGEQGIASGEVSQDPAPTDGFYAYGTSVILTAEPAHLSIFDRWEGVSNGVDLSVSCSTSPTCTIEMAEDTNVKPVFRQMPRLVADNLHVSNSVSFSPQGIPCGNVGYACQFYEKYTQVTMTPVAGSIWEFDSWEGEADCADGNVFMNDTLRCIPRFNRKTFNLSVEDSPAVTVSSDTGAINCGVECTAEYLASSGESTVLLTATPASGWLFVGWAGSTDCHDDDEDDNNKFTTRVTVGAKDVHCNIVAYEEGSEFALTVQKQGGGYVKAEALPVADSSGINCGFDACSQNYPVLTKVQLTATETRGSKFSGFDTQSGSNTYTGNVSDNVCYDGQIMMASDVICIARFNSSVLVVDGSNSGTPKESNEYIAAIQSIDGLDYDIWSVGFPTKTSNPDARAEPNADDLAKYGRVIWYTGDTNADSGLAAGPSPTAEASLAQYLDGGGCFILSSPEYYRDRAQSGLSDFAQTYLGVSEIFPDQTETHVRSSGLSTLGFSQLESSIGVNTPNPFNFQNASLDFLSIGNKVDSIVHNPAVAGSEVIFKYLDGGNKAAIAVDNDVFRSVFMGFPFLGLNSGNDQNNVMQALMDFCELPERDDLFEPNNNFSDATELQGFLSQKTLRRMSGDDDYFRWTATNTYSDATFNISFTHETGDLSLEVYDGTQTLVGSSQSQRSDEDVYVADVTVGQVYYVRVLGQNDVTVPYVLSVASDGDRDHDGVLDSGDGLPDDPTEQYDSDGDLIGNNADLDDDNDGLPDSYEIENGFDPLARSSGSGDEDLDGFTNLEEYTANTDPNDPNSFPADTVPPVITTPDNITVAVFDATGVVATDSDIVAFLAAATANDNIDGAVTVTHDAGSQFDLGINMVTFSATDNTGNTSSESATVTVTDQTVPVITLIGLNSITLNIGDTFTDQGATVTDNVDADRIVLGAGSMDTNSAGNFTLTYSASDAAGNVAQSVTRNISVEDNSGETVDDNTDDSSGGGGAINLWMLFILFSLNIIYVVSQRARVKQQVQ